MNTRSTHILAAITAAAAMLAASPRLAAQPMARPINTLSQVQHVGRTVPHGGAVWDFEGPHELRWHLAFDATPLTTDAIPVMIALVNDGRPVDLRFEQAPRDQPSGHIELTLLRDDGSRANSWVDLRPSQLYRLTRAAPGKFVAGAVVDPRDHFGDMPAGEYRLGVRLIINAALHRARDGHQITPIVDATTPEMRIKILDRGVPESVSADQPHTVTTGPIEFDGTGSGVATWATGLDEHALIMADLGFVHNGAVPDAPVFAYPMLERWTNVGWIEPHAFGSCGTGRGELRLAPGQSLKLRVHASPTPDAGVYRFSFRARTESGTEIRVVTPEFQVPLNPRPTGSTAGGT